MGIRINHQCAVLDAATCAQVCSVAHLDHIHRLLPCRFRREMDWPPVATVYEGEQSVSQERMEDIIFAADPEPVVQRRVF